ncbi:TetR/AcrR family transcriptional regulator, partial [Mesorhizobium sp. M7A.F.Ca.CA.003.01.2.1]
ATQDAGVLRDCLAGLERSAPSPSQGALAARRRNRILPRPGTP